MDDRHDDRHGEHDDEHDDHHEGDHLGDQRDERQWVTVTEEPGPRPLWTRLSVDREVYGLWRPRVGVVEAVVPERKRRLILRAPWWTIIPASMGAHYVVAVPLQQVTGHGLLATDPDNLMDELARLRAERCATLAGTGKKGGLIYLSVPFGRKRRAFERLRRRGIARAIDEGTLELAEFSPDGVVFRWLYAIIVVFITLALCLAFSVISMAASGTGASGGSTSAVIRGWAISLAVAAVVWIFRRALFGHAWSRVKHTPDVVLTLSIGFAVLWHGGKRRIIEWHEVSRLRGEMVLLHDGGKIDLTWAPGARAALSVMVPK